MYLARFSYSVLPVHRQRAIDFIRREVEAAGHIPSKARMLVPLTRGQAGRSLQFEVEVASLDEFEEFRERGIESDKKAADWMREFGEILTSPPAVELLRIQES